MGARGTKPHTAVIGGVEKTFEEWGKPIGLQKESFRHRFIKLGPDHPMLLATRDEYTRWWVAERGKRHGAAAAAKPRKKGDGQSMRKERAKADREMRNKRTAPREADMLRFSAAVRDLLTLDRDTIQRYETWPVWDFLVAIAQGYMPTTINMRFRGEEISPKKSTTCDKGASFLLDSLYGVGESGP